MTMNLTPGSPKTPKKKRGAMHLIRVALYMLRKSGKSKTSMQIDVASKGPWKEVLGSMRPLHLQGSESPPPPSKCMSVPEALPTTEQFEEAFSPPMSPPAANSMASSSSVDGMSQYASALNLQELDTSEESTGEYNDNGGDEMIDVKAEEFINQFYEDMRIQNLQYMKRSGKRMH